MVFCRARHLFSSYFLKIKHLFLIITSLFKELLKCNQINQRFFIFVSKIKTRGVYDTRSFNVVPLNFQKFWSVIFQTFHPTHSYLLTGALLYHLPNRFWLVSKIALIFKTLICRNALTFDFTSPIQSFCSPRYAHFRIIKHMFKL